MLGALVVLLRAPPCCAAFWTSRDSSERVPHFEIAPNIIVKQGQELHAKLEGSAGQESFLDTLLGTDCYSTALKKVLFVTS